LEGEARARPQISFPKKVLAALPPSFCAPTEKGPKVSPPQSRVTKGGKSTSGKGRLLFGRKRGGV